MYFKASVRSRTLDRVLRFENDGRSGTNDWNRYLSNSAPWAGQTRSVGPGGCKIFPPHGRCLVIAAQ